MADYVLDFQEIDQAQVSTVGGKGANMGELSRLEGVSVPRGFCVTTEAFRRVMSLHPSVDDQLARLSRVNSDDSESIRTLSTEIRSTIEGVAIPDDMATEITNAVGRLGEQGAYAVRSSATAEDLPTASFAGQHDTYLNVVGPDAVVQHVRRCWASLFTERAVAYRLRNGIDQRTVSMAVVVQQMVFPSAAGILFTADPVTSNRKVASVEAVYGHGEELVSGLVNADVYKVRGGEVIARMLVTRNEPVLSDPQVVRLAALGRRIEAHFGRPQDIEWCLVDDGLQVVQSRPITTLFPIPANDGENHVYLSVGHQQMMTDPMKPLGMCVWQLTALRPMFDAGGRLFVDVTRELSSPGSRARLLDVAGKSDPLIRDALETVLKRGDFIPTLADEIPGVAMAGRVPTTIETDEAVVAELISRNQASIAALKSDIRTKAGSALIDFILEDIGELKRILLDRQSGQAIMASHEATWWLNEKLEDWLGEKNAVDTLTESAPNNVTSEMGLALLDVADAIRPHPAVVAFLQRVEDDGFLDEMPKLPGGAEARDAISAYLDRYGMRCAGEIDITRPRWSERPLTLLPAILGIVRNMEPGEGTRRFEQGRQAALHKEHELLARLRALEEGERKAQETKQMIDRVRAFIGYREYPKYGIVSRYFVYKLALLEEAESLVQAGVLREKEDIFYLTLQEFRDVVLTRQADDHLIRQRKAAFESYKALTPPRVLTSDGEVVTGEYRRDGVPPGALAGLAVSGGTVEGRARVVLDMAEASLEAGDILITVYTDPSWTPLFVAIKGLVTEVGGLMTHGAVIAREYGLPAVVGVMNATRLIRDGQRIRVHGTEGYVEILGS
jgi:pyruvate,water dikinase